MFRADWLFVVHLLSCPLLSLLVVVCLAGHGNDADDAIDGVLFQFITMNLIMVFQITVYIYSNERGAEQLMLLTFIGCGSSLSCPLLYVVDVIKFYLASNGDADDVIDRCVEYGLQTTVFLDKVAGLHTVKPGPSRTDGIGSGRSKWKCWVWVPGAGGGWWVRPWAVRPQGNRTELPPC